jgi:hypothetical protein
VSTFLFQMIYLSPPLYKQPSSGPLVPVGLLTEWVPMFVLRILHFYPEDVGSKILLNKI